MFDTIVAENDGPDSKLVVLSAMFDRLYKLQVVEVAVVISVCQAKHLVTLVISEPAGKRDSHGCVTQRRHF